MTDAERLAHEEEHYALCRFCEDYHHNMAKELQGRHRVLDAQIHTGKAKDARDRGLAIKERIDGYRAVIAAAPAINLSDAALANANLGGGHA